MTGHNIGTVLIGMNKAYIKGLNYISYIIFILKVIFIVLLTMEFSSLESKIQII